MACIKLREKKLMTLYYLIQRTLDVASFWKKEMIDSHLKTHYYSL